MMPLLAALIVAAAVLWAARQIAGELRAARDAAASRRLLMLVGLYAPGIAAAQHDPRAFLVWYPLAKITRQLLPADSAALDRAAGGAFPFPAERVQAAHAQWTADWLAWERTHDGEYKLKAVTAEQELAASPDSRVLRGKLDAIEREKLDTYQRRYAEYVRIAKALQSLQDG
jgi:hypothetical protein